MMLKSMQQYKKSLLYFLLFDFLHLLSVVFILIIASMVVLKLSEPLNSVQDTIQKVNSYTASYSTLPQLNDALSAELDSNTSAINAFFIGSASVLIACYILLLAVSAYFKSKVWQKLSGKKHLFLNFLKKNAIMYSGLIVICALAAIALKETVAKWFIFILVIAAIIWLQIQRSGKKAVFRSIWPIIKMAIVFVLVMIIMWVTSFISNNATKLIATLASLVLFFTFLGWSRLYLYLNLK